MLGIERVCVMGGSAGGSVAQVFVRRHPEMVEALVVSQAGVPNPERGRKIRKALRWLRLMPMGVLRMIARKRLSGLLPAGHPELVFIRAYMDEALRYHLHKKGFVNLCRRGADLDLNWRFEREDLADWSGKVLLIMADDDPSTPQPVREALMALYPEARIHVFHGVGHAAPLLRREEYLAVIERFLTGDAVEVRVGDRPPTMNRPL
jgi:pimeloyl-ACP methyl ester carboxylesterase